jgi:hypothetical protein
VALQDDVFKYIREARANPALATEESLERLEAAAARDFRDTYAARTSPMAEYTWMTRTVLPVNQDETNLIPIKTAEPVDIVGFLPVITSVDEDANLILPGLDAFDVAFEVNRREFLTHQAEDQQQPNRDRQVVSLSAISATIANRLFGLALESADPIFSYFLAWSIPEDVRTARGYGATQISINMFIRPRYQRDHTFKVSRD